MHRGVSRRWSEDRLGERFDEERKKIASVFFRNCFQCYTLQRWAKNQHSFNSMKPEYKGSAQTSQLLKDHKQRQSTERRCFDPMTALWSLRIKYNTKMILKARNVSANHIVSLTQAWSSGQFKCAVTVKSIHRHHHHHHPAAEKSPDSTVLWAQLHLWRATSRIGVLAARSVSELRADWLQLYEGTSGSLDNECVTHPILTVSKAWQGVPYTGTLPMMNIMTSARW